MTVSSQTSRIEQLGDGTTTAFAVNFYFLENSDLKVFVNGVLQTITTNYTVTGAGNPAGGTVTFVSAPANGVEVVIFRDPALTQGLDYIDNDPFPAESHERGLDKLTMIAQRVKDLVSRALRLGDSVVGVSTELPALTGSQLLGTKPDGSGFQLYPLGSEPDTAANIVHTPAGTGSVATTVDERLNRMEVNVFDFFTDAEKSDVKNRTSVLPVSAKVQAAIDSLPLTGGVIIMPKGRYLWDTPVKTRDLVVIQGEGDSTEILVNTDIEVFNSDTTTVSTAIFQAEFRELFINKTVTGATTKYDIHLQNPNICQFHNVHIKSGHIDTAYSATNLGGIWLDKPAGSTSSAFMNRVINCWIQNNSIYFLNLTDSVVSGGFVWGHVREFAIRINGGGACAVENVVGLITSKFKGGIWIDGVAVNQVRIHGNEFDGNPLLDTGTGVYCPQSSITVTVTNNTFWGCDFHGIETVDPIGWTITGNNFWKNNAADNFYDDIRITGSGFQPNGNVVSGNTHVIDELRNNKGYAIREINAGFNPVANTYSGNGILGGTGYAQPAILVLQNATQVGNAGLGAQNTLRLLDDSIRVDNEATVVKNNRIEVANGGTLDLIITTEDYLGNPGSYVGTLLVSTTRSNFALQSRRTVFAVAGYGTTLTSTSLHSQDGSGGGATFTLTAPSNGVIRFTNTSGNACTVDMMFVGTKGLA